MRNNLLFITLFITMLFLLTGKSYSQDNAYALVAEVMPQPIGGMEGLYKNISYPDMAKKTGVSGKVYLLAFINERGDVDNVKVIKGIGAGCDEAAIKGIRSTKFNPAMSKGEAIKAKLSIPVTFQIM